MSLTQHQHRCPAYRTTEAFLLPVSTPPKQYIDIYGNETKAASATSLQNDHYNDTGRALAHEIAAWFCQKLHNASSENAANYSNSTAHTSSDSLSTSNAHGGTFFLVMGVLTLLYLYCLWPKPTKHTTLTKIPQEPPVDDVQWHLYYNDTHNPSNDVPTRHQHRCPTYNDHSSTSITL